MREIAFFLPDLTQEIDVGRAELLDQNQDSKVLKNGTCERLIWKSLAGMECQRPSRKCLANRVSPESL